MGWEALESHVTPRAAQQLFKDPEPCDQAQTRVGTDEVTKPAQPPKPENGVTCVAASPNPYG